VAKFIDPKRILPDLQKLGYKHIASDSKILLMQKPSLPYLQPVYSPENDYIAFLYVEDSKSLEEDNDLLFKRLLRDLFEKFHFEIKMKIGKVLVCQSGVDKEKGKEALEKGIFVWDALRWRFYALIARELSDIAEKKVLFRMLRFPEVS